jgi:HEAT repeat protein
VQNFRAVILGLRDEDDRVRRAASQAILGNFSVEEILEEYGGRENHSMSLLCNLR